MNTSDYLQINLIPITALIIMWVNARETLAYTWRNHALRFLMTQIAGIMTVDVAAWALNGSPSAAARFGLWVLNTIYFGMLVWISFIWFLYVKDVVEDGMGQRGKDVILPALPLGVYLLFLIANLWNHQLFYIDEQNYFVRGDYFQVCMLMALGYLVAASVRALFLEKTCY